jgi:hypothetical protein
MASTAVFIMFLTLTSFPSRFQQDVIFWTPNVPLLTPRQPILSIADCSQILPAGNAHNYYTTATIVPNPRKHTRFKPLSLLPASDGGPRRPNAMTLSNVKSKVLVPLGFDGLLGQTGGGNDQPTPGITIHCDQESKSSAQRFHNDTDKPPTFSCYEGKQGDGMRDLDDDGDGLWDDSDEDMKKKKKKKNIEADDENNDDVGRKKRGRSRQKDRTEPVQPKKRSILKAASNSPPKALTAVVTIPIRRCRRNQIHQI